MNHQVHVGDARYQPLCGEGSPLWQCHSGKAARRLAQRHHLRVCEMCETEERRREGGMTNEEATSE